MAIQPIDLQVMFTQLDSVGKAQAAQKDGLVIQQTLQNIQKQEKTEASIQSVNESQNTGDGAEGVNERNGRKPGGRESSGRRGKKNKDSKDAKLWDPQLGKNIDISG
jgi:hypothetical protein